MKQPIDFHFADSFSLQLKRFASSFLKRRTMDSLMPYSVAFSELFSTASATILSLNARLYNVQRAVGMITYKTLNDCEHGIV